MKETYEISERKGDWECALAVERFCDDERVRQTL
jgi:hypothetical protein